MLRAGWLLVVLFVGCATSGGGAAPDGGLVTTPDGATVPLPVEPGCPAGQHTSIRGRVTFPNGTLPVQGALVYVPRGAGEPTRAGQCGECIDSGALVAHTTTGVDGTFELVGVPAGAQALVIEKGKFRRTAQLQVQQCVPNAAPDAAIRLPASSAEGQLPRVAVVTGDYDRMEVVLEKLGLAVGAFDLYEGGRGGEDLFNDMATLSGYDIVFVNCGAPVGEDITARETTILANAKAFVESGGRLYVTDLSYNLIEQSFADRIDFAGGSGDGLTASPEAPHEAEIGDEITGAATVMDSGLGAWLVAAGATSNASAISVSNTGAGFAVMDRVDAMRAKAWVEGNVASTDYYGDDDWYGDDEYGAPATPSGGLKPLTVTFEQGCGRVLYTSYHTAEESWDDIGGGASPLSPQEMILAYLVLEIGSCIEEPTLF